MIDRRSHILVATGLLLLVGCQQKDSLSGSVTYNGVAVEKGSVSFQPVDGKGSGFGAEVVDGKYSIDKVKRGKHSVSVRGVHAKIAPQSTAEAIQQYEAAKAAGKKTLDHLGQQADYIPDDAEGNGATVDVVGGSQTLDLNLKGPPR